MAFERPNLNELSLVEERKVGKPFEARPPQIEVLDNLQKEQLKAYWKEQRLTCRKAE